MARLLFAFLLTTLSLSNAQLTYNPSSSPPSLACAPSGSKLTYCASTALLAFCGNSTTPSPPGLTACPPQMVCRQTSPSSGDAQCVVSSATTPPAGDIHIYVNGPAACAKSPGHPTGPGSGTSPAGPGSGSGGSGGSGSGGSGGSGGAAHPSGRPWQPSGVGPGRNAPGPTGAAGTGGVRPPVPGPTLAPGWKNGQKPSATTTGQAPSGTAVKGVFGGAASSVRVGWMVVVGVFGAVVVVL
ncbi:hypothetical protein EJ06DRAFT_554025 [Trichodelitschia bisporula]|uniref:Extracellular membrane protein CFEM domain-containing protein n=1 Tax=Trichodelitschia bisporula TaxID=703511 RepID=A0A6G1I6U6_9PEZI|nr:hypothetical protein EJ06DRAFT_554025 [Trichodelitschia bisporula]